MAKEALETIYNRCVFRETFRSEAETRKQASSVTDVDFSNGAGSFNGTSSKISYNLPLNGTYSVRIKVKNLAYTSSYASLIDFRNSTGADTDGYVFTGSSYGSNSLNVSSGTIYVNGVISSNYTGVNDEIVVTGITVVSIRTLIGVNKNFTTYFSSGFYDLVEIYQGTLTASEVKNLYENKWNKELSPNNLLLNFDSTQGTIKDRTGKNTLTATDVTIKKTGSNYAAWFNGSSSKIDTGTDMIGTKSITCLFWFKQKSEFKSSNFLLSNKQLDADDGLLIRGSTNNRFVINSTTSYVSPTERLKYNKWQFLAFTLTSGGVVNVYFGSLDDAPALLGSADTDTGDRVDGDTNLIIGNKASGSTPFDGLINKLTIYEGILSLQDITRAWSSSLNEI